MVRVSSVAGHDNSPKNLFLRDFNIAAARLRLAEVGRFLAPDAVWRLYEPAGQKVVQGREAILDEYRANLSIRPKRFVLETVVSHGRMGAASGRIEADDGRNYVFCDTYRFASGKGDALDEITSYVIEETRPMTEVLESRS